MGRAKGCLQHLARPFSILISPYIFYTYLL